MPSKHTVAVVLDTELLRRIKATAERETISASAVVRRVLKAHFFARDVSESNVIGVYETISPPPAHTTANGISPNGDTADSNDILTEARK